MEITFHFPGQSGAHNTCSSYIQRALSLVKPVDQVVIAEDTEHVGAAEDVAPEDG